MQRISTQAILKNTSLVKNNLSNVNFEDKKFANIWIDRIIFGGYLTYSALDVKTYYIEPERSTNGVIENLNSYATFLTPQVTIEFKYMKIEAYRNLMKLIYARNEHVVKYYDIVYDKFVTKKMYFKPEQLPEIFRKKYEILAIIDYKLELVGTNADLNTLSIIYHLNPPNGTDDKTTATNNIVAGEEILIGEDTILNDGTKIQSQTFNNQWKFAGWNTQADGNGFPYTDNQAYTINDNDAGDAGTIELYAQWESNDLYVLSYNYGLGKTAQDPDNNYEPIYSKNIRLGETYGTLPTTDTEPVTYKDKEYYPYKFKGWYKTATIGEGSIAISENSVYNVSGNSTIYQQFDVEQHTIKFNMNYASYNQDTGLPQYNDIVQNYGVTIYKPQDPTQPHSDSNKEFVFSGWYTTSNFAEGSEFTFTTMPPVDITLYAKWTEQDK